MESMIIILGILGGVLALLLLCMQLPKVKRKGFVYTVGDYWRLLMVGALILGLVMGIATWLIDAS